MKAPIASVLFAAALLAGCGKEELLRHKFSGVYTVVLYDQTFYAAGEVDSTYSRTDLGAIGLFDNDINPYNNVSNGLQSQPRSWYDNGVGDDTGGRPVGWYTDEMDGRTITFFSEDAIGTDYAIFTVEEQGGKEYTWTYVGSDDTGLLYKEVWTVERH